MGRTMAVKPELRSVGVVRAVGPGKSSQEQCFVRCARHGGSVPVETCESCPQRVALRQGKNGAVTHVTCYAGALDELERESSTKPLSLPRVTVGDIMTRNVLCVRPELSLDAITELFVDSGLKAAPVVDEHGTLLGIVSESEVLIDVYAQASAGEHLEPSFPHERVRVPKPRTVADVMIPFAFTLPEHAPITRAAAVMAFESTYRITVVSERGSVVGIVSAADVLYWLAKSDGYALPPPKRFEE